MRPETESYPCLTHAPEQAIQRRRNVIEGSAGPLMKRRLLLVAIFLLAGAVVNVAVAWGCAVWSPRDVSGGVKPICLDGWPEDSLWLVEQMPVAEPGRWTTPWGRKRSGIGVEEEIVSLKYVPAGHANLPPFGTNYSRFVRRCCAGLPLLSLEGFRASGWVQASQGALSAPRWLRPVSMRLLPLRPIWPGFAVNTLLYAVVLWLLSGGPFVLRRFIRVKRGLCSACAYPHGESDVCSECGKPLPGRMAVTT